jgi:hypothetical protein
LDFEPTDQVTKSNSVGMAAIAIGTLGAFCFLAWAMFADSKTAGCVTKARLAASDLVQIHDIRWSLGAGCEYFASTVNPAMDKAEKRKAATSTADAIWMPEAKVILKRGAR